MPTNLKSQSQPRLGAPEIAISARQRLLLKLLDLHGGSMQNLDFQKVLFLFCQRPESNRPYDFVPYRYGAFSFTSYADRRKLIDRGLLVDDDHRWQLTFNGQNAIEGEAEEAIKPFILALGQLRGDALVAETYRRFPYYATKSEIVNRVLNGDTEALDRIAFERKKAVGRPLQTIGYEGHSLESYLNVLIRAGVTLLCDVRRNPISRKYGFSKSTLSNACNGIGILYQHLPKLGIASEDRQELKSQQDYDLLFAGYEREYLPQQVETLETILGWINEGERIALTCFEHLPQQCHRHCVAKALEVGFGMDISTKHL